MRRPCLAPLQLPRGMPRVRIGHGRDLRAIRCHVIGLCVRSVLLPDSTDTEERGHLDGYPRPSIKGMAYSPILPE